jgi:hypothetical protein
MTDVASNAELVGQLKGAFGGGVAVEPLKAKKANGNGNGGGNGKKHIAAPPPTPSTPTPLTAVSTGPRVSLAEKLRAATSGVNTVSGLRNLLADARSVEDSQEAVDGFVGLYDEAAALAVFIMSSDGISEAEATRIWNRMSWDDKMDHLRTWTKNDVAEAEGIRTRLNDCFKDVDGKVNTAAQSFLLEFVSRFVNPLKQMTTIDQLLNLLDELAKPNDPTTIQLVTRIIKPRFESPNGLRIRRDGVDAMYIPKEGVRKIARAWKYIKQTYDRVAETYKKIDALRVKSTVGLTLPDISHGREGLFFLPVGNDRAILMEAKLRDGKMTVGVTDSAGFANNELPNSVQSWDARRCEPATRQNNWHVVCEALDAWKSAVEEAAKAARQAQYERRAPLVNIATFSIRFEDQGLTKILRGEKGIAAFWMDHFFQDKDKNEGLLGVAIEHCGDGRYVVREVISDFPWGRVLIGRTLPLEVDPSIPSARLQTLPRMERDRYTALKMVARLISLRLRMENPVEDKTEEGEGSK